jgi:hypothetical protein
MKDGGEESGGLPLSALLGFVVEPSEVPPEVTAWTLERQRQIRELQTEVRWLEFELETQAGIDQVVERTLQISEGGDRE